MPRTTTTGARPRAGHDPMHPHHPPAARRAIDWR